jgi:predicted nuclease of predicted toxin-antitoxin system
VRLLLDEHLSARRVGAPLRRRGHDVEALHEEPGAWGLSDEQVLERAAASGRIVVTRNGRDFIELARAWSEAGQSHAGILVVWGRSSNAPAEIVAAIHGALSVRPDQEAWVDLVLPA